jgi:hypothetical protein
MTDQSVFIIDTISLERAATGSRKIAAKMMTPPTRNQPA